MTYGKEATEKTGLPSGYTPKITTWDNPEFFTDYWYQDEKKLKEALEELKRELKKRGGKIDLTDIHLPKNILLAIQAAAGALKSNEYSINTLEPIEAIMARENVVDQDGHVLTEELLNALNKNVDLMNSPGLKGINEFANWLERTGIAEDFYKLAIFVGMMSGMEKGHYEPEPQNDAEVAEGENAAAKAEEIESSGEIGGTEGADVVDGIDIIDGKVGGKIPVDEYKTIRHTSVKNPDADSITLGKFEDGGANSYIAKAGKNSSYFDMGSEWDVVRRKYGLSGEEMFDYFNKPVLSESISSGKTIRFSHDPRLYETGFIVDEWEYIKSIMKLSDANLVFDGGFWYVK